MSCYEGGGGMLFSAWKGRETVSHHNLALNCWCVLTGICSGHFMLKVLSEDPSVSVCFVPIFACVPFAICARFIYVFDKCSRASVDTWI